MNIDSFEHEAKQNMALVSRAFEEGVSHEDFQTWLDQQLNNDEDDK